MNTYEIRTNPFNLGLYCFFEHNGSEFYAYLCFVPHADYTECMIFAAKDGQVATWAGLYCKRDIPVTEGALVKCIEDFKRNYKEDQK